VAFLASILTAREIQGPCPTWEGHIVGTENGAEVSWDVPCPDVRRIRIYRALDSRAERTLIAEQPTPPYSGSFVDDTLPVGSGARYELTALRLRGGEELVESARVVRLATVPRMRATTVDLGIDVSWTIGDRTNLTALSLERRRGGGLSFDALPGDSLLAPATTHVLDSSIEPGATYEYRLRLHYGDVVVASSAVAGATAPHRLALGQNVPNPFNPVTRIRFLAPSEGRVEIRVYDVRGALVRTLFSETVAAGVKEITWDGRDDGGSAVASGIYFCRLDGFGGTLTKKMVLVR
jgi:hypothetical protein